MTLHLALGFARFKRGTVAPGPGSRPESPGPDFCHAGPRTPQETQRDVNPTNRQNTSRLRPVRLAAVALLVALPGPVAWTQTTGRIVREVRVEGNSRLSDAAVRSWVRTRPGQQFLPEVVRDDQQRLLDTGRFRSVVVTRAETDDGVIVTFNVTERPLVTELRLVGNKLLDDEDLLEKLRFRRGDPLSDYAVEQGREAIVQAYQGEGHHFATVTVEPDALREGRVVYRIIEGPKVTVRKLRFEGNEHFGNWKLRQTSGVTPRIWPFTPGHLDMEQVEQGVNAIRELYIDEGFLDAEVGRVLEFSPDKTDATVTYVIRENQRYRINEVTFTGNELFSDEELAARLKAERGEYLTKLLSRRDVERLEETYGELGHIYANVTVQEVFVDPTAPPPPWAAGLEPAPALVNLEFDIRERARYRVGRIDIRGNDVTQDRVIRRELRFFPEQLYNTVAVEESRSRLAESRLFDSVNILPTGEQPGVRDAVVEVSEGRTAQFIVGAGVSTNSGLLGNVAVRQRNFDILGWPRSWREFLRGQSFKGAGQTLSIVAEPGTELMRFHVEWFEPYLFDQPYSLGLRSFLFSRERESYDETRFGGVASVGHRFKNRWYGELATRIEGIRVDDLEVGAPLEVAELEGSHTLLGLETTLVRDRTDSRWLPSDGDRIRLSYEQVVGDFEFGKGNAEYRIYRTVHLDALDRKHILAGRFAIGQIFGDAPVFERFYGGGIGSVRGFEYRGISPRGAGTDEAVGGDTMLFAGTEYTFPLIGGTRPDESQIRGVFFLDSGTVEEEFEVTTYRISAGFGIRWTVPFFGPIPISMDFGFPLNKDDEDEEQVFSFSLGWTF